MNTDGQLDLLELTLQRAEMDLAGLRKNAMKGGDAWISAAFIGIQEDKIERLKRMIEELKLKSKGLEKY